MGLHRVNAHIILVITIIVSAVIASIFIFPPNESVRELFGVLSFLYGIFVAFAISNSSARFSKVVEKLETEEAFLLYIYTMSALLGARVQKKTQALIDDYLISQLDHFLKDYRLTYPHFLKIFQFYIKDVRPEKGDELQKEAFEDIIDTLKTLMENRKQIELNIQDTMTKLEWVCIGALLSLLLFAIFYMNSGTLLSIVLSVLLATTAVVFVAILWELNMLKWKDQKWVWADLTILFQQLDLMPYYPKEALLMGKVDIQNVKKARVATYLYPYPNFSDKKIEIIENPSHNKK